MFGLGVKTHLKLSTPLLNSSLNTWVMYKHLMVNNGISGVWEEMEYSRIVKLEESVAF